MISALIIAGVLAAIGVAVFLWWPHSARAARWDLEIDRQWAEMQIEQLGREARARMRAAADEVRSQQRSDRP